MKGGPPVPAPEEEEVKVKPPAADMAVDWENSMTLVGPQ